MNRNSQIGKCIKWNENKEIILLTYIIAKEEAEKEEYFDCGMYLICSLVWVPMLVFIFLASIPVSLLGKTFAYLCTE